MADMSTSMVKVTKFERELDFPEISVEKQTMQESRWQGRIEQLKLNKQQVEVQRIKDKLNRSALNRFFSEEPGHQ